MIYGDDDPEDAYDVHDSVMEIVENVRQRIAWMLAQDLQLDDAAERLERIRGVLERVKQRVYRRMLDRLDPADD
jgi:hypothetical protein